MLKPDENSVVTNEQQATQTPEESGGEKLFTQADLDRIIGERLQREREKAQPTAADQREVDLRTRESKMDCREFVTEKGYPAGLLDVLDTSDFAKFQNIVQKLDELVGLPSKERKLPVFSMPIGPGGPPITGAIANAFKPKI